MGILGINFSHDGTLSYVDEGRHVFSIAEERINRTKAYLGFPFAALRYVLDHGVLDPEKVSEVAVAINYFPAELAETLSFLLNEDKKYYDIQNDDRPSDYYINDSDWKNIRTEMQCKEYVIEKLSALLLKNKIHAPIVFHKHHLCHAASAYYSSGYNDDKVLAITMDGEGDGLSASVNQCENGRISVLSETDRFNSAGYLYSAVTKQCGFKVSRHEGKITGLAAYGNPDKVRSFFSDYIRVENGQLRIKGIKRLTVIRRFKNKILRLIGINVLTGHRELINRCSNTSNADLSAGIQNLLEDRIKEIVSYWSKRTGINNIVLAGGVFANVKFNQHIGELDCVKKLYIFPDMGDGGLAYGAAMLSFAREHEFLPQRSRLETVYLGPEFSDDQIKDYLNEHLDLDVTLSKNIAKETAALIENKRIVGWFQGRMEYGPRSLGNRSILASPVDASINKWLNDRMNRTEFMPFAPSCLYDAADDLFEIPKESLKHAAEFMTITFKMKKAWLKRVPAIVHIDNTARPQLVKEAKNPLFHQLLTEYKKQTGLPLMINTSFNAHEEPIVCNPGEAIKSLEAGMIDVLAIGNFIVKRK